MTGELVPALTGFGRALRAAGLSVGTGDLLVYCAALARLDPTDLVDLYWAGRTALVTRRDDLPRYDEVFRQYFLGADAPVADLVKLRGANPDRIGEAAVDVPVTDPDAGQRGEETSLGLQASAVDVLRHKAFAACSAEELDALRRIMARIRLTPPRRRSRRSRPARTGRLPDLRRTVRESLRRHGDIGDLHWRRRRQRPRPLILILDVSGSMADYSRALLQFAHTARRAARKVEVFCFGTRLTCITGPLRTRRPDEALRRAAERVVDWEGGTRIGDSLDAFIRGWGRRGLCRGGIVVICSDGLDRGNPEVLEAALERLSRLCHRIVWLNPNKGDDRDFAPSSLAMLVAEPHIDLLGSGHDLASLDELAALLPTLG
jgi:uncharacterized protein